MEVKDNFIFMGSSLPCIYYCTNLSYFLISESLLCSKLDFRIIKEANSYIITNNLNSTFTEVIFLLGISKIGGEHYICLLCFIHTAYHSPN